MDTKLLFEQFNKLNIIIIGDIMIDRYLTGKVDRISPEAPVPVVHLGAEDNRLGGAANVALNIQAMGARPLLFSVVGQDENGDLLEGLLPQNGISSDYILKLAARTTTVKTRVIAQNQHLLRVDREDSSYIQKEQAQQLLASIKQTLDEQKIDLILFQDYNKGVLSPFLIETVIQEAKGRSIPTAVDPKDKNFWAYKHIDFFKPNLREIQQQLGFELEPSRESLDQAALYIHERLENEHSMITLSDKGLYINTQGTSAILPTTERSIADVCGAGDTVISIAALCLALALPLKDIAILSNLAGGQVCEKVGVVPVDKNQLLLEYMALQSTH